MLNVCSLVIELLFVLSIINKVLSPPMKLLRDKMRKKKIKLIYENIPVIDHKEINGNLSLNLIALI